MNDSPGLLQKPSPAVFVTRSAFGTSRISRRSISDGKVDRKILLQGNSVPHFDVASTVDNAEPAMPENCLQFVVTDDCSHRKGIS